MYPAGQVGPDGVARDCDGHVRQHFRSERNLEADFVFGGVTDKEVASFVVESSIKTPADLKGTRLAIDRLGDYSDFRARKVLEMFGLQAQKDVTLLQIGAQTARFAALRNGHVQSTFVVPPLTLVARKAGLRELADLG